MRYTYNKDYFKTVDTEEKAYWLGFLFADGSIMRNKKILTGLALEISNKDLDHLKLFKKHINSDSPILYVKHKDINQPRLRLCSKELAIDLGNLGMIPNKSLVLTFPSLPESLIRHFIRGYFDGDGNLYINKEGKPRLSFLGTYNFLKVLSNYLSSKTECNKATITTMGNSNIFRIQYGGKNQVAKITKFLYKNSNISLVRKRYTDLTFMEEGTLVDIDVVITAECPLCHEITIETLTKMPKDLDIECSLCKEYYTITT